MRGRGNEVPGWRVSRGGLVSRGGWREWRAPGRARLRVHVVDGFARCRHGSLTDPLQRRRGDRVASQLRLHDERRDSLRERELAQHRGDEVGALELARSVHVELLKGEARAPGRRQRAVSWWQTTERSTPRASDTRTECSGGIAQKPASPTRMSRAAAGGSRPRTSHHGGSGVPRLLGPALVVRRSGEHPHV